MKIETLIKNFAKCSVSSKTSSVIPYEMVIKDSKSVASIAGFCDIPESKIEEFMRCWMKSFERGGVNYSISESLGYIPYPNSVTFKRHGIVQYVWTAPMFMIW